MKRMGIAALYRKLNTPKPAPGHKTYPYLLRGVTVDRPDQAWVMDLTYVPMARGFVYLAAVVGWYSRRVLAWRLSITMEAAFCIEALEEALACHGKPDVFNTDQGSLFTGQEFTGVLLRAGMAISMDGKGVWRTTCSSNGFGGRSSVRGSTSEPTTRSARPGPRSAGPWPSTMAGDHIRALTEKRRTRPTSTGCRKPQQPELGKAPLRNAQAAVQTTGATSRELRPTATYRKVTGGFRSDWGADLFAGVRSVIGTVARRGVGTCQAIQQTLHGQVSSYPG